MNLRRILASPFVALMGLTILALWPVVYAGYPSGGDGLNHFYRLVEFDHLLRNGVWFPRWATDLCYGYGCPVFNFSPPLVYYLGALLHALGLSYAHSLLGVYGLGFGLAISGAYRLASEQTGVTGGLIAASAYGLAPYFYFNALARGALPETLGLGLLPWVLWAFARLTRRSSQAGFVAATVLYAVLILSHLLSALLAAPLVAVFVWVVAWRLEVAATRSTKSAFADSARPARLENALKRSPTASSRLAAGSTRTLSEFEDAFSGLSVLGLALAAIIVSILLASFFLLPAVLETNAVQIYRLTAPGDLDFHNNFLTLNQLLALPQTYDPQLVFIPVPPSLSLTALVVAIVGFIFRLRRRTIGIWELGLGSSFLLLCCSTFSFTAFLWERLPFAQLIQFPWRLVGPASLLLALLAASAAPLLEKLRFRIWILGTGVSAFFLFALPWTFAPVFNTPAAPTVRDLTSHEMTTGQLGTTSAGEFLPLDVRELPAPDSLRAQYAENEIIDRLAALPEGVRLIAQSATLTTASATVETPTPTALTFNFFYFPGWRATIDGRLAPLRVSSPHGLITVPIEAGQHTVAVRFGPTPLRVVASAISIITLSLLLALTFRLRSLGIRNWGLGFWASPSPAAWLTLTVTGLLIIRLAIIDGRDTIFRRSRFDGASVAGVSQALDVNFDNQLVLIGLDQPLTTLAADQPLLITLYWRAQNPPNADYSTTLQVVDEHGNLFGQSDSQHPGRAPTSRWGPDQYARDEHALRLLPGTPPGAYQLRVGVYQFGGSGLSVLDQNQVPQGQTYTLGKLTVTRATRPPAQLDAAQTLNRTLGPLTLLGQTLNTTSPQAGDDLRLLLFWEATHPVPDLTLRLELVADDGTIIQALETSPARADYPTSAWTTGEIVRAPLGFRILAAAPAGAAMLRASLLTAEGAVVGGPSILAALDVRVPERSFSLPTIAHSRGDEFGGKVKLLGYDLTPNGITLYWQALAPMDVSYTAFVHALDAGDHLLAQVDRVPLNGTRPTTGWLPGEILSDPYSLTWSGAAKIEIGLYNAQNKERLGTIVVVP